MTPIPDDVAAAIVAAGHSLRAGPVTVSGYGHPAWLWSHDASVEAPMWDVVVGGYHGRGPTPRVATLDALARYAAGRERDAAVCAAEAKRRRDRWLKADALKRAEHDTAGAAELRALAARVAEMWPEVTP